MYLIIGLGNYAKEYDMTRHNVGFYIIDKLAKKYNIEISRNKFKGLIGQGKIGSKEVMLVKPQTFMNLSGDCVSQVVNFYKIPLDKVIVIYDDLDLSFGTIRYREKGSSGTHNGMRDIVAKLGRQDFKRIRLGIMGETYRNTDIINYVTGKFTKTEQEKLEGISNEAIKKLEECLK